MSVSNGNYFLAEQLQDNLIPPSTSSSNCCENVSDIVRCELTLSPVSSCNSNDFAQDVANSKI